MAYLYPLSRLPDRQLLDALTSLVSAKRRSDATLLAHIAEVDRRKLYAAEGYDSMFLYCTQVLRLSEGGAYSRITVARAAREYPLIFDKLAAGAIHHSGLRLLAPQLTRDNHRDLLDAASTTDACSTRNGATFVVFANAGARADAGASATEDRAAVSETVSSRADRRAAGQRQARPRQGAAAPPEPARR